MNDLRFSLRVLTRSPLLALIVILSLGLGIGANTAIFSLLHEVVLRSLPVPNPHELVLLQSPGEFKGGRNSTDNSGNMNSIFSYKMFRELEKYPQGVQSVAAFRNLGANLSFQNQTVDGSVIVVSGRYFPTLQVTPLLGRLIGPSDDVHGAGNQVVVLSHRYWQNQLGGRREVLNQPLRVNGHVFTIVGVTPKGFTGTTLGSQPDVFVPLSFKPLMTPRWNGTDRWNDYWLYLFARLQPGTRREQAEAGLNSVYRGLVEWQANETASNWRIPENLKRFRESRLTLVDGRQGQSSVRDDGRTPLLILMASTLLVLLIAIANTANLLLARAAQRQKELAIRLSLGAARWHIIRQVLSEALLLAILGGLAGLVLATWTTSILTTMMSGEPGSEDITGQLAWPVLLFAAGASLLTGLLAGLYPAWQSTRASVVTALKDQAGTVSAGLGAARMRKALVCGQVMFSALLLIPTGLFLKSMVNLLRHDLGLKTENLLTFGISPELNGYKPAQSRALFERIEEQIGAIPGVTGITSAMVPLVSGSNWGNNVTVEGYSRDPKADTHSMFNMVGAGFLGKVGIPLVNGRDFTERDTLAGPKVAIVNERWARHFFGQQNPLGRRFATAGGKDIKLDIEIVGVAKDAVYSAVKQETPRLYYTPWRQSEDLGIMTFYVRTALPEAQMVPQIQRVMKSLDPDLPLADVRMMDETIRRNLRSERNVFQLSLMFAALATILAALGLYGVMAYSVTRRTREIGIRVALGAPRRTIRGMVLREALVILAIGLVIGVPAATVLARLVESELYGVKSFDAQVMAGAVVALTLAALLAGYLPARRATRIDPVVALRTE